MIVNLPNLPPFDFESKVLVPNLTPFQYFAFRFFCQGHSIKDLQKYQYFIYPKTIRVCVLRTAFGLQWQPGLGAGKWPYLCPFDEDQLAQELSDEINSGHPSSTSNVLSRFQSVAELRIKVALEALLYMGRTTLYKKFKDHHASYPTYKYLYSFIERHKKQEFQLMHMDEIEVLRIANACPKILTPWYHLLIKMKAQYRNICICGADEMGIELSTRKVNFLTKRQKNITVSLDPHFPHTTVMFTHFMGGERFPPFVIMQGNKETKDMRELLKIDGLYIAFNASGWMTEAMFALWCLFFSCQLTQYKISKHIPPDEKILLILDGHSSRSNVLGLEILRATNVEVLTLISHTSHVSQMFDVQLASPLKYHFDNYFTKYLSEYDEYNDMKQVQKERISMLRAVRDAWGKVATPQQCEKSAQTAGYCVNDDQELRKFFATARISSDELASFYRKKAISKYKSPVRRTINECIQKDDETILQEENASGIINVQQPDEETTEMDEDPQLQEDVQALQTTPADSTAPESYIIDHEDDKDNDDLCKELDEIARNTQESFSRLVISGKILTSNEMLEKIRTQKEKYPNKCLHNQFTVAKMQLEPIESWVVPFFRMLADNGTFLLTNLPTMHADFTCFKRVNPYVFFPRHLFTLPPEAILEYGKTFLPRLTIPQFPDTSSRFLIDQLEFIQQNTKVPDIFIYPTISPIFHIQPYSIEDYKQKLRDEMKILDKELCLCLLRLINQYFPFSDFTYRRTNVPEICPISPDYPYTSALVKEYPALGKVIQEHCELCDLVTKPPINKNIKDDLSKAASAIHDFITNLLITEKNGNRDELLKLDCLMVRHLAYSVQNNQDYCIKYMNSKCSQNKISYYSQEELSRFNQLNIQTKVAILQLTNEPERHFALHLPDHYYPYFCRLSKNLRRIFLCELSDLAFQVFSRFTEEQWKIMVQFSLPDLKNYVTEISKEQNIANFDDSNETNEGNANYIHNDQNEPEIHPNSQETDEDIPNINHNSQEINEDTSNIHPNYYETYEDTTNINHNSQETNEDTSNINYSPYEAYEDTTNINFSSQETDEDIPNINHNSQETNETTTNINFSSQETNENTTNINHNSQETNEDTININFIPIFQEESDNSVRIKSRRVHKITFFQLMQKPYILDVIKPKHYPKLDKRQVSFLKGIYPLQPWQTAILNPNMVQSMSFEELCQLNIDQVCLIQKNQLVKLTRQQVSKCPPHIIPLLPFPSFLYATPSQYQYLTINQKAYLSTLSQSQQSIIPTNLILTHFPNDQNSFPSLVTTMIAAPFHPNSNNQIEESNIELDSNNTNNEEPTLNTPHIESPPHIENQWNIPDFTDQMNPFEYLKNAYNFLISNKNNNYLYQTKFIQQWTAALQYIHNNLHGINPKDIYYTPFSNWIKNVINLTFSYNHSFQQVHFHLSDISLPYDFPINSSMISKPPNKCQILSLQFSVKPYDQSIQKNFLHHKLPFIIYCYLEGENYYIRVFGLVSGVVKQIIFIENSKFLTYTIDEKINILYILTTDTVLGYDLITYSNFIVLHYNQYKTSNFDEEKVYLKAQNGIVILSIVGSILIYKPLTANLDNIYTDGFIKPIKTIQTNNIFYYSAIDYIKNSIYLFNQEKEVVEEYELEGQPFSFYPVIPSLDIVFPIKHNDDSFLCIISSFNSLNIINIINTSDYMIMSQICYENFPIKILKTYYHGRITLIFFLDFSNQLLCLNLENHVLLFALKPPEQIIDFNFDIIDGTLTLLIEHLKLVTISWPIPNIEDEERSIDNP